MTNQIQHTQTHHSFAGQIKLWCKHAVKISKDIVFSQETNHTHSLCPGDQWEPVITPSIIIRVN